MQIIDSVSEMRSQAAQWKAQGKTVALVPTQGSLHAGQEALIRAAVVKADVVVVSIFVNPLQFGPNELGANVPPPLEQDVKICEECGAHCVFTPNRDEIYPRGYSTFVIEEAVAKPLDGVSRPTHFRGVATIMVKFFNILRPDYVFFGQKTAQRAAVVRKMAADLGYAAEIVVVPTVRDADGQPVGVRNPGFTATLWQESLSLGRALMKAKEMADAGVRSTDRIIAEATHILSQSRRVRIIYISIVDVATMEPVREVIPGKTMLAIAVWADEMRVIDNVIL